MTKRLSVTFVLAMVLVACASVIKPNVFVLRAQALPVTKPFAWVQADAVTADVTGYTVVLDTNIPIQVPVCAPDPTICSTLLTFNTAGPHQVKLTAHGKWGDSPQATLNVSVVLPSSPTNLTIK